MFAPCGSGLSWIDRLACIRAKGPGKVETPMLTRNHGAVLARFCILWMASASAAFAQGPDSVSAGGQDTSSAGGFPTFTGVLRVPHPDYRVLSLTPPGYAFKVTGMDWMSNGDLAVLTISDTVYPQSGGGFGTVYRLKGARDAVSNALPVETLY